MDAGIIERLVPLTRTRRAVTERCEHDAAALTTVAKRRGDTDGVRQMGGDDRADREDALRPIGDVAWELPSTRTIVAPSEHRVEQIECAHADAEQQAEIAIVGYENVRTAFERRGGAGLQRFMSLAAHREGDLPLAIELEPAIVDLPLQEHRSQHSEQLLVGESVTFERADGGRLGHEIAP